MGIKCELAKVTTSDGLALHGLLFEPESPQTAIIHVHGWTGNFYENEFIDLIAKEAVSKGIAFLSIETRGSGHVQEFIRNSEHRRYVKIGGSLEVFEDCVKDINAFIKLLAGKGYNHFLLEGHSTGCQKIVFYTLKSKEPKIAGLILLEPTDDPEVSERLLGKRFHEAVRYARGKVDKGQPFASMPGWVPFGVQLSAQRFLSMSDPNSSEGSLFNYSGRLDNLKKISVPVLAIYGSGTQYQLDPKGKLKLLCETITNCESLLLDCDHWFTGQEKRLAKSISSWSSKALKT